MAQVFHPLIYTGLTRAALRLAEAKHRGTSRKSTGSPYALHPVAVAQLLAYAGADESLICAAYLHDLVEDTDVTLMEVARRFGERAAAPVALVTKLEHHPDGTAATATERDEVTVAGLRDGSEEGAALKAADLSVNLSDVVLDAGGDPDYLARLYGTRAEMKVAHYMRLSAVLVDRLSDGRFSTLADVLRERSQQVRSLVDGSTPQVARHERVPLVYSGRVRRALLWAERAHRGQLRRGTDDVPYVLHPISVAQVLATVGASDDLICAALLEDAVEEGSLAIWQVEDEFGEAVAGLVRAMTRPGGDRARTDEVVIRQMRQTDDARLLRLKAADLIVNVADINIDRAELGEEHLTRLFGDRVHAKVAFYVRLSDLLCSRLTQLHPDGESERLRHVLRDRTDELLSQSSSEVGAILDGLRQPAAKNRI